MEKSNYLLTKETNIENFLNNIVIGKRKIPFEGEFFKGKSCNYLRKKYLTETKSLPFVIKIGRYNLTRQYEYLKKENIKFEVIQELLTKLNKRSDLVIENKKKSRISVLNMIRCYPIEFLSFCTASTFILSLFLMILGVIFRTTLIAPELAVVTIIISFFFYLITKSTH